MTNTARTGSFVTMVMPEYTITFVRTVDTVEHEHVGEGNHSCRGLTCNIVVPGLGHRSLFGWLGALNRLLRGGRCRARKALMGRLSPSLLEADRWRKSRSQGSLGWEVHERWQGVHAVWRRHGVVIGSGLIVFSSGQGKVEYVCSGTEDDGQDRVKYPLHHHPPHEQRSNTWIRQSISTDGTSRVSTTMLTDDKFENAESYQRQLIGRSGPTEWSIARLETMLELGVIM